MGAELKARITSRRGREDFVSAFSELGAAVKESRSATENVIKAHETIDNPVVKINWVQTR